LPCSFCHNSTATSSSFCVKIQPLKINKVSRESNFLGLALNLAFVSLLSLIVLNSSDPRIRVLSVYIPTMLNALFVIVIKRQGSYINMAITSFSLWYLWYIAYYCVPAFRILYSSLRIIMIIFDRNLSFIFLGKHVRISRLRSVVN
jgi:hypothetical protein